MRGDHIKNAAFLTIVRNAAFLLCSLPPYGGNELPWRRSALSECFSSLLLLISFGRLQYDCANLSSPILRE